ncbi:MAG: hypothetical protein KF799_13075 [Bdellovibrionales bacterium]|nr:hypothetical protein [Bdellovibrionales bacterium]
MQFKSVFFITLSFLTTSLFFSTAYADIEWSGVYRIEANNINNSELSGKHELNYALSHLVLRPKIIAADGLTIYGQFDIFNNAKYPNSQLGQIWGSGVSAAGATSAAESSVLSGTQKAETLQVSQLYLTLTQEYGALVVGRVPIQFGLGMTYSAGNGLFDHWYDTDDLVGYKVVLGNLWIMPMYGKTSEKELNINSDDVNDLMVQLQYDAPESDIEVGVFYRIRSGGVGASDAPLNQGTDGPVLGGASAVNGGKVNLKTASLYALKDTERYRFGLEASFQSGDTGTLTSASGDNVQWDAYGIAAEFELRPENSNFKWGLKAGTASGDDPSTDAKFEGFLFNRNYNVAMLMFNHSLGRADFLRTRLVTGNVRDANGDINVPDVETISNVMYAAPSVRYTFNDKWSLDNTVVTGWLSTNPLSGGKNPGKSLGYEWDISLNFSPRKGVMWINEAGLLFPGQVWKGDGQFDSGFAFGLATKAAISF